MQRAIPEFLAQRRIAVVGVSRTRGFGNVALRELRRAGYESLPVNVAADAGGGEPCFRHLSDVPAPPPAVLAVVPPGETRRLVGECIRIGVRHLWMQQGSESEEAIRLAESAGISVVHDACILMYAEPHGVHRLHGWIARLVGRA